MMTCSMLAKSPKWAGAYFGDKKSNLWSNVLVAFAFMLLIHLSAGQPGPPGSNVGATGASGATGST
jgi:hypothetical protein